MSNVVDRHEVDLKLARNMALEDAARAVEASRMPDRGDGPTTLIEVKTEMAKVIRRLKR